MIVDTAWHVRSFTVYEHQYITVLQFPSLWFAILFKHRLTTVVRYRGYRGQDGIEGDRVKHSLTFA